MISRNKQREFYITNPESITFKNFVKFYQENVIVSARSVLVDTIGTNQEPETLGRQYIRDMREEQKELIEDSTSPLDLSEKIIEINKIEKDIEKIKRNKKFVIRTKTFAKSVLSRLKKVVRFLWRHKRALGTIGAILGSIVSIIVGYLRYQDIVDRTSHFLKSMKDMMEKIPKYLKDKFFHIDYGLIAGVLGFIVSSFLRIFDKTLQIGNKLFVLTVLSFVHTFAQVVVYFHNKFINSGDFMKFSSYRDYATSHHVIGEIVPDIIAKEIARIEGITYDEYRKEEKEEIKKGNKSINNKIKSYVYYASGKTKEIAGETISFIGNNIGIVVVLLIMFIIIKWIRR